MTRSRKKRAADIEAEVKPDVAGARANLERIKQQRAAVDRLVTELTTERRLNDFTANTIASVIANIKGGRAS